MQLEMFTPSELVVALERKYGSLSSASRKMDMPLPTLAKVKKGSNPRWDTLLKIADGLGEPLPKLLAEGPKAA